MDEPRIEEAPVQATAEQLDSFSTGRDESLARIFEEHRQRIYRAAYRITGNGSDAEDVLQTVFLRLLRRERGEHLGEHPARYLHLSAVNGALDLLRLRATARTTALEDLAPVLVDDDAPSPDQGMKDIELHGRVRAAIAQLSPTAARAFTLRYLEGYDNAEVARALGTSRAVVAVTLHRARASVRKELKNYVKGSSPEGDSK